MARGGKRTGSGRKLGAVTKRTREIANQALAEGKAPLEVMLDNMRHFQQVALDAEKTLEGLTAEEITGQPMTPDEQFKHLLAQVKKAAGFRIMAHECARDAASYMHPRLAAIALSGKLDINHEDALNELDGPRAADQAKAKGRFPALRGQMPEDQIKSRNN